MLLASTKSSGNTSFISRGFEIYSSILLMFLLACTSQVNAQTYPKPNMVSPASGAVIVQTGANPCFSWTPVNDSRFKSYVITVSLSTNFPDQRWAYDVMSMSTTSVCWNGGSGWVPKGTNSKPLTDAMKSGVTHYWRALATFNDGSTVTGTEITGIPFSIVKPSPSPVSPANGAIVDASTQNPCFSWSMSSNSEFSYYTVTLSPTTDFPSTRWTAPFIYSISTTNVCWNNGSGWQPKGSSQPEMPTASTLKNGATYYWRVLATYADGTLTGQEFVGRSFVYRAPVSSSVVSSSRSSSSATISSSSRSSSSVTSSAGVFDFTSQAPAAFNYSLTNSGLPSLGSNQLVAITRGNLSINNGAANYSIDIELPPAVRDLKPKLSLNYNSRSGNGLMGVGWNLNGLSAITRCRTSFATERVEAQKSNPRYSIGDRLCLDGQKLVVASSSTPASDSSYWSTGTEYKTELDNFARIVSYGSSANGGHGYFKVWTKDGRILTYGAENNAQNSKVYTTTISNSAVSMWLLDRVEDAYGNYYTINYLSDASTGDYYPQRINFSPGSAVVFKYQARQGQVPWGYSKGNYYKRSQVLDSVTTYINVTNPALPESGMPVRQYDINYKLSAATSRELVDAVSECGYQTGSWRCAKPLVFNWDKGDFGFDEVNTFNLNYCSGGLISDALQIVDLDADGFNDLIKKNGKVAWGGASQCYENGDWVVQGYELESATVMMTMNGYALLTQRADKSVTPNKQIIGLIYNINKNAKTATYTEVDRDDTDIGSFVVDDVNNDGLDDFHYKGQTFSQRYQVAPQFVVSGTRNIQKPFGNLLIDLDGDGLREKITTDVNYETSNGKPVGVFVVLPSGVSFEANHTKLYSVAEPFRGSPIQLPGGMHRVVIDVNGDGNKDFMYHHVDSTTQIGYWFYRLNNQNGNVGAEVATGIIAAQPNQSYYVYNHYAYAFDYDQDGREDLLTIVPSGANFCKLRVLLARDNNGTSVRFEEAKDALGNQAVITADLGVCSPVYSESQAAIFMGDANNDGIPDINLGGKIYPGKQKQPDILNGITDGFNASTEIRYSTLQKTISYGLPLYSAGEKPVFPQMAGSRGSQVVTMVGKSNGLGNLNYQNYFYTGPKIDRHGRGFLGFENIKTYDNAKALVASTNYRLDWPFIARVKRQEIKDTSGKLISITDNSYALHPQNLRFPYLDYSLQKSYELSTTSDSFPLSVSKKTNIFDTCGNLTEQTTRLGNGVSGTEVTGEQSNQRTINVYDYYGTSTNCSDDFLLSSTQEVSKAGGAGLKRVITEFIPNGQREIRSRTDFKGEAIQKTTTYDRETNGVINKITEVAKDIDGTDEPARITSLGNFVYGIYPQTVTNAENHATTLTYDYRFGSVKTETFLGQTTTTSYDPLGRLQSQQASDGTLTENITFYCNSAPVACPTGNSSAYYGLATRVTHTSQLGKLGEPLSIVFYDSLQREVRSAVYALDGKAINQVTQYSDAGNLYRVSEPYVTSGIVADISSANSWTVYSSYDALGRANNITGADGGTKTTGYSTDGYGFKITDTILVVKPVGGSETQTSSRWVNALGQVVRVEDALFNTVSYNYDAAGNLENTQVNNNLATTIELLHDAAGNKTYIKDPDAGVINFEFNGFGELRKQIWQKGVAGVEKNITYDYDKLGRQTSRIDKPASGSTVPYSWVWDTKQQGQLSYRTGNGFLEEYFYDGFSRLSRQTVTTSGLSGGEFVYTYDNFSRPETVRYPNGFKIQRDYHAAGYQVQTRDVTATSRVLWALGNTVDTRGAFNNQLWGNGVITQTGLDNKSGRLTSIKSGRLSSANTFASLSGDIQNLTYSYDSLGNLITRSTARTNASGSALENLTETFGYDKLNRVKTITTSGLFARTQAFDYDTGGLGNLINRSDLLSGSSVNNDVGPLKYEQLRNAGVHAVTSSGGINYSYDKYGNMIARGSESIIYDTFNKPTRIAGASITDFYYGPDHELYKETSGTKTTYKLAGGLYEVIVDGSTTTQKSYVDGVILNNRVLTGSTQTANDTVYLHTDHLGSTEATTNALGQFVNRMSFSAWGVARITTTDSRIFSYRNSR